MPSAKLQTNSAASEAQSIEEFIELAHSIGIDDDAYNLLEVLLNCNASEIWNQTTNEQMIAFLDPISRKSKHPTKFMYAMNGIYEKLEKTQRRFHQNRVNKNILIAQLFQKVSIYEPQNLIAWISGSNGWSLNDFYRAICRTFEQNKFDTVITLFMLLNDLKSESLSNINRSAVVHQIFEYQWLSLIHLIKKAGDRLDNERKRQLVRIQEGTTKIMMRSCVGTAKLYKLEFSVLVLLQPHVASLRSVMETVNQKHGFFRNMRGQRHFDILDLTEFDTTAIPILLRWVFCHAIQRHRPCDLYIECDSNDAGIAVESEFNSWKVDLRYWILQNSEDQVVYFVAKSHSKNEANDIEFI